MIPIIKKEMITNEIFCFVLSLLKQLGLMF